MAEWKVSLERIKLGEHPNADALELGFINGYQVVVKKGLYKDGQLVIFIPEKSILPDTQEFEGFKPYLKGDGKNRVASQRLRKELSQGIILPAPDDVDESEIGQDISETLGIKKYKPFVPPNFRGRWIKASEALRGRRAPIRHHDCDHFGLMKHYLEERGEVVVTEKVHGTQIMAFFSTQGEFAVSSKGVWQRGFVIEESEDNIYWQAAKNVDLKHKMGHVAHVYANSPDEYVDVQVFGEVIPAQKGYDYGQKEVTMRIFDVRVKGKSLPIHGAHFTDLWVPKLYQGPYDEEAIRTMAKGMEMVSGRGLHIREGCVVRPRNITGMNIFLKVINPKYKETGEELN